MEEEETPEDDMEERRENLRREIFSSLEGTHFRLAWIHYLKSFPIKERTVVSSKELRNVDHLHDQLSKFHTKKEKYYPSKWEKMSYEKKVEELRLYETHEEFMLRSLLDRLKKDILENLLRKHFPWSYGKKKKITKGHIIEEIAHRLYDKSVSLESRKFEEKHIPSFLEDSDQEYKVVTFCDVDLPIEIVRVIFQFHGYNEDLVMKVGRVCKNIYLSIISSWERVTIRKKNIFKYSLLVLRSVREVIFEIRNYGKDNLSNNELKYILSNLNPNRLRKISLDMGIFVFQSTMKLFNQYIDKSIFQNVTHLSFLKHTRYLPFEVENPSQVGSLTKHDFNNFKNLRKRIKTISIRKTFPNLVTFNDPISLHILEGVGTLNSLNFDLNYLYLWKIKKIKKKVVVDDDDDDDEKQFFYFPNFLSNENKSCFRNLKKLSLRIHRMDNPAIFSVVRVLRDNEFLGTYLEVLKIHIPLSELLYHPDYPDLKYCNLRISKIVENLKGLRDLNLTDSLGLQSWYGDDDENNMRIVRVRKKNKKVFECPSIVQVISSGIFSSNNPPQHIHFRKSYLTKVVVKEPKMKNSTMDDLFFYLSLPSLKVLKIGIRMKKNNQKKKKKIDDDDDESMNLKFLMEKIQEKLFGLDECNIQIIWKLPLGRRSGDFYWIRLVICRSRSSVTSSITSIYVEKELKKVRKRFIFNLPKRINVKSFPFLELFILEFLDFVSEKKKKCFFTSQGELIKFNSFRRMKMSIRSEEEEEEEGNFDGELEEFFRKKMEKAGFICKNDNRGVKTFS